MADDAAEELRERFAADPRRLLSPKEVAPLLGLSERKARDWIKEQPGHVVIGCGPRPLYKIPQRLVDKYLREGGDRKWHASTYAEKRTGAGATIAAENDGNAAPISEPQTKEPPNVRRIESSSKWRIRPTSPGRSRSQRQ